MNSTLLLLATLAASADPSSIAETHAGDVRIELFLPSEQPVRGILLHVSHPSPNPTLKSDGRWAELCREIGFAHVSISIDLKKNDRPNKLAAGLAAGLKELAEKTKHPELVTVPFCGVGHSAGGMVNGVLLRDPSRVLTTCVDCAWILDRTKLVEGADRVPALFTLGAVPDGFKMLPAIEDQWVPARKAGLAWGLGVQWGCAHDFGNAGTLQAAWIKAMVASRLPADFAPLKGVPKLLDTKLEGGWLGDRATTGTAAPTVASWSEYKGDRNAAVWLPDRATAFVWRAWQAKEPKWVLAAKATDGSAELPAFDPKKSRDLAVPAEAGVKFTLVAGQKGTASPAKVTYFAGDTELGAGTGTDGAWTWAEPKPGCHPVYAKWETADGAVGYTPPSLILVRGK